MSAQRRSAGRNGGMQIAIIIGIVIIAALMGVIIWLLVGRNNEEPAPAPTTGAQRNVVVNEDNIDELIEELAEDDRVAPGYYEATMNTTWNFPDGSSPSPNAYVENSVANTNDVYFDLKLADTEEVILESPVIPVGSHMRGITLDKDLDAGTYDCVLTYHLIDEDQNTLSTLNIAVTLEIAA